MRNHWIALAAATAVVLGCGPSEEQQKAATAKARATEWTAIETAKKALDAERQQLAELRARVEAAEATAEGAPADEPQRAELGELESQVAKSAEDFYGRVVQFINADPPIAGEPLTPQQLAAIRMKSSEDMQIAAEYIDRGGDYRKAIDIYNSSLLADPDNAELKAALASAEANRYMSEERFAAVKKGMTEAEVVAAIGRPLSSNIKSFPEKKIVAWFYPKSEARDAAGVFFDDKKVVYRADFNYIKAQTESASEGGSED